MPRFLRLIPAIPAILAAFVCGGCEQATRPDANLFGGGLRDAARGIAAGRAYDDALLAARREDSAAFDNAIERLERSGSPKGTWPLVAQSLNSLGYPLADTGRSMQDFVRAEDLTRRSLAYWDKIIDSEPAKSEDLPFLRFNRELGAHDSLAWALYRQKRFAEALREQKGAIAAATANMPKNSSAGVLLADLYYHLGKIHQGLGQMAEAQTAFAKALELKPGHPEAKEEIDKANK